MRQLKIASFVVSMSEQEDREKERARLSKLVARRPKTDDFRGTGVVLSDGIRFYCSQFDLIVPFQEANLKPANYKLTVGDEYAIGGKLGRLPDSSGNDVLAIPPFEVAIIKTRETVNMPRFLIARWNIQVQRAYQGLLWVGGPQVDAGYVGNLFCPIYNLSNETVPLRYGDPFAVIDFVKTTEFHENSQPYPFPPDRILFQDYRPQTLRSALATTVTGGLRTFEGELRKLGKETKERIDKLEERTNHFLATTTTVIAILFALLAVFVEQKADISVNVWSFLAIGIAVFAVLVALGR